MLRITLKLLQQSKTNGSLNVSLNVSYRFTKLSTTAAEPTSQRFSNIKRKNYNNLNDSHVEYFRSVLGNRRVLLDAEDVQPYNVDFPKHIKGNSEVVLLPKNTKEVSSLLKFCYENNLAVCPQGGNSGLVGGSVPVFDEIIISTSLMKEIIHLDEFSGALICQSGCVLEELDNYLENFDLMMPLDLGAKGICHIGGNIATNAGGIRLFRYGNLHGNILGLEVVLANGEILDLISTVRKDNTGYHLKNLFIGAEGTLGIITKVSIQCPPLPKNICVAFLGFSSFNKMLETLREARIYLNEIASAFEVLDNPSFEKCLEGFGLKSPLNTKCKFYMLMETRGGSDGNDINKLTNFINKMLGNDVILDAFVTDEPVKVRKIWEIRENVSLAFFKLGYVYKYDISLPIRNFYKLVEIMRERVQGTSATLVAGFGHFGDGNLHLNICSDQFDRELKNTIEPYIFEKIQELKGSISAEHGIGIEKPSYLHMSKSTLSINLMKDIKNLLDPKGILNPYKVLP